MTAPHFALPDQDAKIVDLDQLHGQALVLYFYPRAMTPGCTQQACDFRDRHPALQLARYRVIGISPDPPPVLRQFIARERLDYTLLSDVDESCHRAYGAYGEKERGGNLTTGILRSTFVVDAGGMLTHVFYRVDPRTHVDDLLAALAER